MKKAITILAVIFYGSACLFYGFREPSSGTAYNPDSDLRRDSIYQKDGTDSIFRYLRSNAQNKFLYRIRTALYDRSGIVSNRLRIWADTLTPTTGSAYTISIASAGFSKVLSVQAQIQTNTTTANDVPIVAVKSYTTSEVVLNIVQGNAVSINALGANVAGLRFLQSPPSSKVHLLVVGY